MELPVRDRRVLIAKLASLSRRHIGAEADDWARGLCRVGLIAVEHIPDVSASAAALDLSERVLLSCLLGGGNCAERFLSPGASWLDLAARGSAD
ncbi:MAG: hypothetical protein FJ033_11660 [Chloroflexi bacterium]|nr:hypothetical protein [Chloroflexota bacterium]